jgi:hypothetical protein
MNSDSLHRGQQDFASESHGRIYYTVISICTFHCMDSAMQCDSILNHLPFLF